MNLTRREFLNLSAAATVAAALPLGASAQGAASSGSQKKGLGLGSRNAFWPGMLTDLRCKWCYTWTGNVPPDLPEGVAFVPMIRSKAAVADRISRVAEEARNHGITELLGLNEPDAQKQDDMSVEQALEVWPLLMETGMRLGSPACIHADNEWMTAFMAGVEKRKLRVDFVCVHSYAGPNAQALVSKLDRIHSMYGRPLWLTEFGVGDWSAKSVEDNKHSPDTVFKFMDRVLPMLDDLAFLERYAWFPSAPDSAPLGTSALFDANGELTPLGELYRDA